MTIATATGVMVKVKVTGAAEGQADTDEKAGTILTGVQSLTKDLRRVFVSLKVAKDDL